MIFPKQIIVLSNWPVQLHASYLASDSFIKIKAVLLTLNLIPTICGSIICCGIIVLNYGLFKIVQMLLIQDTFEFLCYFFRVLGWKHINRIDNLR